MDLNSMPKNRLALIGAGIFIIVVLFILLSFFSRTPSTGPIVNLKVWGTDPKEAFAGTFAAYAAARPNVIVQYTQVPRNGYEAELISAFATGKGPDVFMVSNHDIRKYARLISPATTTQIRPGQMGAVFPQAASDDLIYNNQVYALPLYIDTLTLVYNRDKLDQAGIAVPPATWDEFLRDIPPLKTENAQGQLTAAAAAIGGTEKTVTHAADIMSLLMMQNGTEMTDNSGAAKFASAESGKGSEAFSFYLDFANAGSPAYTWNEGRPNSIESFLSGNTAMIFAYREDMLDFAKKSPFLNWSVAPMPQTSSGTAVNFPSYQALTAWVGGKNQVWAWDFIVFATTNNAAAKAYANATGRPAALRAVLGEQAGSADMGIFAKQALTARSWSMPDYANMKNIMSQAVLKVLRGEADADSALAEAQTAINQNREQ
jgi:arabinogalactan oligomer/maltooligosaccharide transport system substrate-binding protein